MFDDGFLVILVVLALFYLIGLPILVLMLFARNNALQGRLDTIEKALNAQPAVAPKVVRQDAPVAEVSSPPQPEDPPEPQNKTPWQRVEPAQDPVETLPSEPAPPGFADRAISFLRENWVYAISALSLALAGVFLVQYGVENGLLPPAARVAAALVFGLTLIAAGEWIRRRSGDEGPTATVYLPSVFSGAGVVSLFGGILAARVLYDLIGPGTAFAGFGAVTVIALVLGWFYGPLLAAIGLIGGYAAPFILGGSSDTPETLLLYFGLLAVLGLGIDTVRRWAWISVLTVVLALAAACLLWLAEDSIAPWAGVFAASLALLATIIPARTLWPNQRNRTLTYSILGHRKRGQPDFPVLLSAGTLAASTALIVLTTASVSGSFWLGVSLLSALIVIFTIWSKTATGVQDLPLSPVAGVVACFAWTQAHRAELRGFRAERLPEAPIPYDTMWLLGIAALVTLVFAWRSGQSRVFRPLWAAAAAIYLPLIGLLLEYQWSPADVIGAYPWALQSAAVAVVMVLLAERFARADGTDRTRASLATMSALSTLAFTFSILFTDAALTIALAAVVASAAALDRHFKLPLMEWFILAGVAALSYRLVVDPGLPWYLLNQGPTLLLAQAAATAACLAGYVLLKPLNRPKAALTLESGTWAFAGIFLCTALAVLIDAYVPTLRVIDEHWGLGLYASVWIIVSMVQLWRMEHIAGFRRVRWALATLFALTALGHLGFLFLEENPFTGPATVLGPPALNTLIPAFLLPALLIGTAALRLTVLPKHAKTGLAAIALAMLSFWLFLTIRHFWQGADGMRVTRGFSQPELYTYTLALLITGGALFYQSLTRRSDLLRRAGLAVIAVAIAKVFLIDIQGLTGLIRVFSLLALGLMLAGMAWIDRWAKMRSGT